MSMTTFSADWSDDLFRLALEAAPSGQIVADGDGRIILVNAEIERIFGYSRDELIGQAIEVLIPERYASSHPGKRAGYLENPSARVMGAGRDLYGVRKDGSEVPVEVGLNPLQSSDLTFILAAVVDISARKQSEEEHRRLQDQMQHAQKMESLGVLAGGIAHEFNNVLTAILGNAELAADDIEPDSPAQPALSDIMLATQRAAELCKQMLAYSGHSQFMISALDVSNLVKDMSDLINISVTKKIVVHYELQTDLPAVAADPTQLRQVIMNLMTNASEAIGEQNGTISISTKQVHCDDEYIARYFPDKTLAAGEYVALMVSDSGSGMSEQIRERVFEPFFSTKFTGRGLGMSAVLGVVESHGGGIRIETVENKGTKVTILLPQSTEQTHAIAANNRDSNLPAVSGQVLLVDDESAVRTMASQLLKKLGFQVTLAEDGHDAVEKFRDAHQHLSFVLMDMTMPKMSGLEAYAEFCSMNPEVPVIFTSGYNEGDAISNLNGKGPTAFLQKPFSRYQLKQVVNEISGQLHGHD